LRWRPRSEGPVACLLQREGSAMAGSPGGKTTETDRITVALIPKAGADLQHLLDKTGLSKTDLVNRAISLYEFVDESTRADREVLIRDKTTGETQAVVFI
jgi:hypothetical protein